MATKYWYKVYGKHKKTRSEELYVGDVLAENQVQARLKGARKFPKWKITRAKRLRLATTSDILRYS